MRTQFSDEFCIVLGKDLLWATFPDLEGNNEVPLEFKTQMANVYAHLDNNIGNWNPVSKIPVIVTGHDGQAFIDDIPDLVEQPADATVEGNNNNLMNHNLMGNLIDRPIQE